MEINHIRTERMRNDAHYQFHANVKRLIAEHTPQALKIEGMSTEYTNAFNNEDEAVKKIYKSIQTEQIKDTDKARDSTWRGLVNANKAALRHPDTLIRESAKHIKIVVDTYGNIAKKTLLEQTSAITNIVQDFEGPYNQYVTTVGLRAWVLELKSLNITLNNLIMDRMDEKSTMTDTAVKEARARVDKAYYAIVKHINARVEVEGGAAYDPFIRKMNENIAEFATLMAQTSNKHKKKDA